MFVKFEFKTLINILNEDAAQDIVQVFSSPFIKYYNLL